MSKQAKVEVEEDLEQATEFQRRRNMARVEARIIVSGRSYDVFLRHHQLGDVGSMTQIYRRGKLRQVLYVLPKVEGL